MYNQYHDQEQRQYPNQPASERYQPGDQRHHNMSYDMGRDEYGRPISGHAPPHAQSLPSYDQGERYRSPNPGQAQQFSPYHQDPYERGNRHGNQQHHEQRNEHRRPEPQAHLHASDHYGYDSRRGEYRGQRGERGQFSEREGGAGYGRHGSTGPLGREHPYGGYDRNEPQSTHYNPNYRPEYERGRDPGRADMNQPNRGQHHHPQQGHYRAAINRQPGYAGNFEAQQGHLANERDQSQDPRHQFGRPHSGEGYPEGRGPSKYHGSQAGPGYARSHNPYIQHQNRQQFEDRGQHGGMNQHEHHGNIPNYGGFSDPATWEQAKDGRSRPADRPEHYRQRYGH